MGFVGLWIAACVGLSLQAALFLRLILKLDWQEVADAAKARITEDKGNLAPEDGKTVSDEGYVRTEGQLKA